MNRIKNALSNNKGFSLVELMVVIVIMLILAGLAVPSFTRLIDDAKIASASAEAKTILTLAQLEADKGLISGAFSVATMVADLEADRLTICKEAGLTDADAANVKFLWNSTDKRVAVKYVYEGTDFVISPDTVSDGETTYAGW